MPGASTEWTPVVTSGLSAAAASRIALVATVVVLAGALAWQRAGHVALVKTAWRDEDVASKLGVYRLRTSAFVAKSLTGMAVPICVLALCVILAGSAFPATWPFGLGLVGGLATVLLAVRAGIYHGASSYAAPRRLDSEMRLGFRAVASAAAAALVVPAGLVSFAVHSSLPRAGELGLAGCLIGVAATAALAAMLLTRGDRFQTVGMRLWSLPGAEEDRPYEMVLVGPEPEAKPVQTLAAQAGLATLRVTATVATVASTSALVVVAFLGSGYAPAVLVPWIVAIPTVSALASWWTRQGGRYRALGLGVSSAFAIALALSVSALCMTWLLPVTYRQVADGPAWVQSLTGYVAAPSLAMLFLGGVGGLVVMVCGQLLTRSRQRHQGLPLHQRRVQRPARKILSLAANGFVAAALCVAVLLGAYAAAPTSELAGFYSVIAVTGMAAPLLVAQSVSVSNSFATSLDVASIQVVARDSDRERAFAGYLTAHQSISYCALALASAGLMWVFNPAVTAVAGPQTPALSAGVALAVLLLGVILGGSSVFVAFLTAQTLLRPFVLVGAVVVATWALSAGSLDTTVVGGLAGAVAAALVLQIQQLRVADSYGVVREQQRTQFKSSQRKESASQVAWMMVFLMGSVGLGTVYVVGTAGTLGADVSLRWSLLASLAIAALLIALMVSIYAARSNPQDVADDQRDGASRASTSKAGTSSLDVVGPHDAKKSIHGGKPSRASFGKFDTSGFPSLEDRLTTVQARLQRVNLKKKHTAGQEKTPSSLKTKSSVGSRLVKKPGVENVLDLDAECVAPEVEHDVNRSEPQAKSVDLSQEVAAGVNVADCTTISPERVSSEQASSGQETSHLASSGLAPSGTASSGLTSSGSARAGQEIPAQVPAAQVPTASLPGENVEPAANLAAPKETAGAMTQARPERRRSYMLDPASRQDHVAGRTETEAGENVVASPGSEHLDGKNTQGAQHVAEAQTAARADLTTVAGEGLDAAQASTPTGQSKDNEEMSARVDSGAGSGAGTGPDCVASDLSDGESVFVDVTEAEQHLHPDSAVQAVDLSSDIAEPVSLAADHSVRTPTSREVSAVASTSTTKGHTAAESENLTVNIPLPNVPHSHSVSTEDPTTPTESTPTHGDKATVTTPEASSDIDAADVAVSTSSGFNFFGTHPDDTPTVLSSGQENSKTPSNAGSIDPAVAGLINDLHGQQESVERQCAALPNIPRASNRDKNTSGQPDIARGDTATDEVWSEDEDFTPISSGTRAGQIDLTVEVAELEQTTEHGTEAQTESETQSGVRLADSAPESALGDLAARDGLDTRDGLAAHDGPAEDDTHAGHDDVVPQSHQPDESRVIADLSTAITITPSDGIDMSDIDVSDIDASDIVDLDQDLDVDQTGKTPYQAPVLSPRTLVESTSDIAPNHVGSPKTAANNSPRLESFVGDLSASDAVAGLKPIEPPAVGGPNSAALQYKAVVAANDVLPYARAGVVTGQDGATKH